MTEEASSSPTDTDWMRLSLELAARGEGWVEPNPMVGCVLVADGKLIGQGFHRRFGGPHAEVEAIRDAQQRGFAPCLPGATAYVTLEPCCHHGKTPPCTDALIDAGIQRVVMATLDPFPQVAGQGVARLQQANISTEVGVLAAQARQLNQPYLKRVQSGMPWVIAKWAMSLDGKIATRAGNSQWISSMESRKRVHELRARVDAIVVGSGTALADDPLLTARGVEPVPRIARRVVVDSRAKLPLTSRLAKTASETPVLLWSSPEADPQAVNNLRELGVHVEQRNAEDRGQWLTELLKYLVQEYQATNVMVEGGSRLLGALFDHALVDEIQAFIGPIVIGGAEASGPTAGIGIDKLSQAESWEIVRLERSGVDAFLQARRTSNVHPGPDSSHAET